MIAKKPSDISKSTIENLFYQQIRNLSVKDKSLRLVNNRVKTFDMQFSDCWIWGEKMTKNFKKSKTFDRQRFFQSFEKDFVEKDIYHIDQIDEDIDGDLLSSREGGFMIGYLEA